MHCNQNPGTGICYLNMSFDKKSVSNRPTFKPYLLEEMPNLTLPYLKVKNTHFLLHTHVGLVFSMQVLKVVEKLFTTQENLSFYFNNHCTTMLGLISHALHLKAGLRFTRDFQNLRVQNICKSSYFFNGSTVINI